MSQLDPDPLAFVSEEHDLYSLEQTALLVQSELLALFAGFPHLIKSERTTEKDQRVCSLLPLGNPL